MTPSLAVIEDSRGEAHSSCDLLAVSKGTHYKMKYYIFLF